MIFRFLISDLVNGLIKDYIQNGDIVDNAYFKVKYENKLIVFC